MNIIASNVHLRLLYFYIYSNNIIQRYFYVSLIQFIRPFTKRKKARRNPLFFKQIREICKKCLKSVVLQITDLVVAALINV